MNQHLLTLRTFSVCALISLFVLGACSSQPTVPEAETSAASSAAEVNIQKSPNDTRDYRYLVLPNELRVLLVSDPNTDRAAASLSVLRGYYHEPREYPGLAHFLEHMLFIGTEKYPEVDGYQQFISAHGGQSNAYTSSDHTNYFFDIQPAHFEAAMDRFAQFFISPLLDPAYVDREKNAVHSEYQMQIKDDGWRSNAVAKTAMDPGYEGSRFYIGSLDTLGDGVDEALRVFFDEQYSADQMVLVALGSESLDEMEAWVRPMFSAIENKSIGPAAAPAKAFDPATFPARLSYQTLSDSHQLSFNFPVPSVDEHYRTKPARYLTNLLGHEGTGSLHQHLEQAGWIESLAAGVQRLDESNAFISIDIELTEAGRAATDEITNALFAFIELMNTQDPAVWRYDEQAQVAELGFRFQEKSSPTGFVYRTSPYLGRYAPEEVLIADYLMEGMDAALIRQYLSYLRPDNVLIERSGPDVTADQIEAYFRVPYALETNIEMDLEAGPENLHLPEPNPFIPEALALTVDSTEPPSIAVTEPGTELWLAPDAEFSVPRANQTFLLGVPGGLATAEDLALAQLYALLVNDALNPYTYPAMLAGLGYSFSTHPAGFRLALSGYSEKQPALLERILQEFAELEIDQDRFERFQAELVRSWRNFSHERPYTQAYAALSHLLLSTSFAPEALADAAETLSSRDLQRWQAERLDAISVVGLSHGNLDLAAVDAVQAQLEQRLPLADFALAKPELRLVTDPLLVELEVDHNDAAMVLYVQDPEANFASRARSALISQILSQQYFSQLRTEQQLGYVVTMTNRTLRDRGALVFIIQSPVASAADLEAATLDFMREQAPQLAEMDPASFEQFKKALAGRLTEQAKNLRERNARYLADLEAGVLTFDSQARIAELVEALTLEEVTEHLDLTIERLESARLLVFTRGRFDEAPSLGRSLERDPALSRTAASTD
jgi:secreted Zn-dependent insulinase-like peptidase